MHMHVCLSLCVCKTLKIRITFLVLFARWTDLGNKVLSQPKSSLQKTFPQLSFLFRKLPILKGKVLIKKKINILQTLNPSPSFFPSLFYSLPLLPLPHSPSLFSPDLHLPLSPTTLTLSLLPLVVHSPLSSPHPKEFC